MPDAAPPQPPRLLLAHKQKTSGRLRYLRLPAGVLLPSPLPRDAQLIQTKTPHRLPDAAVIREAATLLGLSPDSLEGIPDFSVWVSTSTGDIPLLLAQFTTTDPPFAAAETQQGRFIAITEARDLPKIELEMLRLAYECLLG
jgi:hypothetical protein